MATPNIDNKEEQTDNNDQLPSRNAANPFIKVDNASRKRNKALFVKPILADDTDFPDVPENTIERVFVIEGKSGMGREIAAINFALGIIESSNSSYDIYAYQQQGNTLYNLNSVLTNSNFQKNAIYIIPDVLEQGLPISTLSMNTSNAFREILKDDNAYLILTTDLDSGIDESATGFKTYAIDTVDLEKVLESHTNFYYPAFGDDDDDEEPVVKLLKENKDVILKDLKLPKQVELLFDKIKRTPPDTSDELEELLREVTDRTRSTLRRWFRNLNMNTKVFVMLVALLKENGYTLKVDDAEDFYYSFVQLIRQKPGMDGEEIFIDPRRIGIEDLVVNSNMVSKNEILEFSDSAVQEHIIEFELVNYHTLLWVVAEMLVDQIAPHDNQYKTPHLNPSVPHYIGNPDIPRLGFRNARFILANVVGYIGMSRDYKIRDLLKQLLTSDEFAIRYLVGQMTAAISKHPDKHNFLIDTLKYWIDVPKKRDEKDTSSLTEEEAFHLEYEPKMFYAATRVIEDNYIALRDSSPQTKETLEKLLVTMGERSGNFDNHLNNFYIPLRQHRFEEALASDRAEHGENSVTEAMEAEYRETLRADIALYALWKTEESVLALIFTLANLVQQNREDIVDDVVGIIKTWLQRGLESNKFDAASHAEETEARVIENRLSLGDTLGSSETDARYERKKKAEIERLVLESMAWHVGMMAASLLFQQGQALVDESDKADSNKRTDAGDDDDKDDNNGEENEDAKTTQADEASSTKTAEAEAETNTDDDDDEGENGEDDDTETDDSEEANAEDVEAALRDAAVNVGTANAHKDTPKNKDDVLQNIRGENSEDKSEAPLSKGDMKYVAAATYQSSQCDEYVTPTAQTLTPLTEVQ